MDKAKKQFAVRCLCAAAFILFVVFVYRCPVRLIFGVECPGCGLKRALMLTFQLDLAGAFRAHPLFPVIGIETAYVFAAYLFPRIRINKKAELVIGIITLALLFALWLWKIFFEVTE